MNSELNESPRYSCYNKRFLVYFFIGLFFFSSSLHYSTDEAAVHDDCSFCRWSHSHFDYFDACSSVA